MTKGVSGTKEWSSSSANVMSGCSNDCLYCLDVETLIMMSDGSMRPIKDIRVGDKIVGTARASTGYNKFVETEVLAHWYTTKYAVELTLKNGIKVICSPDHRWLTKQRGWKYTLNTNSGEIDRSHLTSNSVIFGVRAERTPKQTALYKKGYLSGVILGDGLLKKFSYNRGRGVEYQYQFRLAAKDEDMVVRTKNYLNDFGIDTFDFMFPMVVRGSGVVKDFPSIRVSKKANFYAIKKLIYLHRNSAEFCRGFLAGIYDAEGGNTSAIRIFNTDKRILSKITYSLEKFKFQFVIEDRADCTCIRLLGGLSEELRFVQFTDPAILRKRQSCFLDKFIGTNDDGFKVCSIKRVGKRLLCDITTGTENFVANGLVSHNCYAKAAAIKFGRKTHKTWVDEEAGAPKRYGKRKGTIMFPTTHDITKGNIEHCERVVCDLLSHGNDLLIVSKPDSSVITRLCLHMDRKSISWNYDHPKHRVLFRFTIGSMNTRVLKFWEPNAPSFEERLYALMYCFKHGWKTSVSMEPLLNTKHSQTVRQVEMLSPYVTDSIWIGKMNKFDYRMSMNCGGSIPPEVSIAALVLIDSQSDNMIQELYSELKDHPKVKWKESIKTVVGIEVPTEAGLDV